MKTERGNRIAYVTTVREDGAWVGLAEENMRGYNPITGPFETFKEAEEYAKERNARLGLTELEAINIIASSMALSNH